MNGSASSLDRKVRRVVELTLAERFELPDDWLERPDLRRYVQDDLLPSLLSLRGFDEEDRPTCVGEMIEACLDALAVYGE